jgi:hypothetical protein
MAVWIELFAEIAVALSLARVVENSLMDFESLTA